MPRAELVCSDCGQLKSKETLFSKTIVFKLVGSKTVTKQRVVKWICADCLPKDSDWNTSEYSSPGHRSAAKERADAVRREMVNKIFGGEIKIFGGEIQ